MGNINFDYYDTYQEWRDKVKSYYSKLQKYSKRTITPDYFESSYLSRYVDLQYDERDRLCIVIPLVRFLIENLKITDTMIEELDEYYTDYYDGDFDSLFTEEELALIKEDLEWAYKHSGLEEEDNA